MSTTTELYIVVGTTGEYSDRGEWNVAAYRSKAVAERHVQLAKTEADRIQKERPSRYHAAKGTNRFDPNMHMDYTGTDYYVATVPFHDDLPFPADAEVAVSEGEQ